MASKTGILILILAAALITAAAGCTKPPSDKNPCEKLLAEERARCCAESNEGAVIIQCVGEWQYNEEKRQCEFKCTEG